MNDESLVQLGSLETFEKPFRYFTAARGFGDCISNQILDWLESDLRWELVDSDFYEQYEFNLCDLELPANLRFLVRGTFLDDLRLKMESVFDVQLGKDIDCTVHKLITGQRIRIHNDWVPGQETHRFLIQLNRGWDDKKGGFLMLFDSQDPSDVHRVISPNHDSAFGFAISEHSHHAVSTIHGSERYTLVFSFYAKTDG